MDEMTYSWLADECRRLAELARPAIGDHEYSDARNLIVRQLYLISRELLGMAGEKRGEPVQNTRDIQWEIQ